MKEVNCNLVQSKEEYIFLVRYNVCFYVRVFSSLSEGYIGKAYFDNCFMNCICECYLRNKITSVFEPYKEIKVGFEDVETAKQKTINEAIKIIDNYTSDIKRNYLIEGFYKNFR